MELLLSETTQREKRGSQEEAGGADRPREYPDEVQTQQM